MVGVAATPDGNGYYLAGSDGGIFAFGDALFAASARGLLNSAVVGIAAVTAFESSGQSAPAAEVVSASGETLTLD